MERHELARLRRDVAMTLRECECCCLFFLDRFSRTGEQVDADGVNAALANPNSTYKKRYSFTGGDWVINQTTHQLVCNATNSPLVFYDEPLKPIICNVEARITLPAVGDWARIDFDSGWVKVTKQPAGQYLYEDHTGNSSQHDHPSGLLMAEVAFYPGERYGAKIHFPESDPPDDLILWDKYDLQYDDITLGAGFTHYALRASAGVTFDDLTMTHSRPECRTVTWCCKHICRPALPDQLTVTLSGHKNANIPCRLSGLQACKDAADADYAACMAAATTDAERCQCLKNREKAYIRCDQSNYDCGIDAACESWNTTLILDKATETCGSQGCTYVGEVELDPYLTAVEQPCSSLIVGRTYQITAAVELLYYDEDTETTYIRISIDPAFGWQPEGSPGPNFSLVLTTGSISSNAFCAGTSIPLYAALGIGAPPFDLYADEVILPNFRVCWCSRWDVDPAYTAYVVREQVHNADCSDFSYVPVFDCECADHSPIGVGDLTQPP